MAQWCNPLTLKPEQSGGVGSRRHRPHHLSVMARGRGLDKRLAISAIPALGAKNRNFTFTYVCSIESLRLQFIILSIVSTLCDLFFQFVDQLRKRALQIFCFRDGHIEHILDLCLSASVQKYLYYLVIDPSAVLQKSLDRALFSWNLCVKFD